MAFRVKALYDYASGHEDDLNFSVGQIITVTDEEDDDWYGGEYIDDAGTKQEGIFPRNFVEKYEPTAPPRPTRTRPKKESESAPAAAPVPEAAAPPAPPPESPKQAAPEPEEQPEPVALPSPVQTFSAPPPAPAPAPEPAAPKPVQPVQHAPVPAPAPAPPAPQPAEAPSASAPSAAKPAPSLPKPSVGPPPVSEKPSSFKDRIAAFNKAAAPPIAPFKPSNLSSGGAGFIKKPFVAPPPSRNAYVPPVNQAPVAKIYRRDEDPEIKEQEAEALENAGKVGLVPAAPIQEGEAADDQPKPMSLKERLALLQKQQMETAARHAEALGKKEKPKRPPKKRLDSQDTVEGESAERVEAGETSRTSTDEPHPPRVLHPGRRRSSKGVEPRDGNEADMSGAGETTEDQGDLIEKDDSDGRARHAPPAPKDEDNEEELEEEDEEEEEEEDIDPEIRRREELRARMARMAGGMGMPGMAMPLFGAPAPMLPKKKKAAPEKRSEEVEEPASPTARAAPVPLPGLMRPPPPPEPKQPEPEEEEEEEDESRLKTPHQESFSPCTLVRAAAWIGHG